MLAHAVVHRPRVQRMRRVAQRGDKGVERGGAIREEGGAKIRILFRVAVSADSLEPSFDARRNSFGWVAQRDQNVRGASTLDVAQRAGVVVRRMPLVHCSGGLLQRLRARPRHREVRNARRLAFLQPVPRILLAMPRMAAGEEGGERPRLWHFAPRALWYRAQALGFRLA